jgi:hypothetical protein
MNKKSIIKQGTLLAIILLSMNGLFAQCTHQVLHDSGSQTVNGILVTVTSSGHSDTITSYCSNVTQPYLIGSDYTTPNMNGSYTFQFSPAIDSLTLNFSGINDNGADKEIIKLKVNGSHYSIPSVGIHNGCDSLAILTPLGNITGAATGSNSGWNGTTIPGPISQITVWDSVVSGTPNGAVFSLFICSEFVTSVLDDKLPDLLIYPIPANNQITIKGLANRNVNIKLIDQFGRLLFIRPVINQANTQIDVSNFPNGIYYLSINNGETLMTQKVIIDKE